MNYLIIGASSDVGLSFIKYLNTKEPGKNRIYAHYHSSSYCFDGIAPETEIVPVKADLSVDADRQSLIESIKETPDVIMFLPALTFDYMRLKALDLDRIRKQMEVGAYSFLKVCQSFLPSMKKNGGTVLTMLTKYVEDDMPPKFMTDYIVSKYALLGAYKSMKAEYENDRLRFEYMAPDMMNTKFLSAIDPRIIEMNAMETENGRLLMPEDIVPEMYEKIIKR